MVLRIYKKSIKTLFQQQFRWTNCNKKAQLLLALQLSSCSIRLSTSFINPLFIVTSSARSIFNLSRETSPFIKKTRTSWLNYGWGLEGMTMEVLLKASSSISRRKNRWIKKIINESDNEERQLHSCYEINPPMTFTHSFVIVILFTAATCFARSKSINGKWYLNSLVDVTITISSRDFWATKKPTNLLNRVS